MIKRILLISSALVFTFISNSLTGTFKFPDTGQTTCYDAGKVITYPAPGQPLAQDGSTTTSGACEWLRKAWESFMV